MKKSILTVVALLVFFALYQIEAQAQDRWSLEFRPGIDFAAKDIADADLGTGFGFDKNQLPITVKLSYLLRKNKKNSIE